MFLKRSFWLRGLIGAGLRRRDFSVRQKPDAMPAVFEGHSVLFRWSTQVLGPAVSFQSALCWTRELSVRRKLNAMPAVFQGRSVLFRWNTPQSLDLL